MDILTQSIDPSKVSHAVSCHLIHPSIPSLVVSKGTVLEVYSKSASGILNLITRIKLHGLITNIIPIKTVESQELEYLAVSTEFAKISIIKWDFEKVTFETVSLHYYDNYFDNSSPIEGLKPATMLGGSDSDCLCMTTNDLLAFLPLRSDVSRKKRRVDVEYDDYDGLDDGEEEEDDDIKMESDTGEGDQEDVDGGSAKENGNTNKKDGDSYKENGNVKKEVGKEDNKDENKEGENKEEEHKEEENKEESKQELTEENEQKEQQQQSNSLLYHPTFTVPINKLDTSISNIISLKFLDAYREPTLAVLYSPKHTWAGNLKKSKDVVQLVVISLDLFNKTSVSIMSLKNLPYDLYDIIPLKSPLNGFLLIGCNEIIHVDSSGSSQGIIVNKYTESTTDYRNFTKNQNDLDLKLENCAILQIPESPKRLLLISEEGVFYWIEFQADGRIVRNLVINKIDEKLYEGITVGSPSCICSFDSSLFIGSNDGDSLLLSLDLNSKVTLKTEETAIKTEEKKEEEPKDDDDIDYSDFEEQDESHVEESVEAPQPSFAKSDSLKSIAPITNFTLATLTPEKTAYGLPHPNTNEVSTVASVGHGKLGAIATISPTVKPDIKSTLKLSDVDKIWTIATDHGGKKYHYLVTSSSTKSDLYSVADNFSNVSLRTQFANKESIKIIGFINRERSIVQVTEKNIYVFNLDFRRLKAIHIRTLCDDGGVIVHGYLFSNYLLITTSTGDVKILEFLPGVINKGLKREMYSLLPMPSILDNTVITTGSITISKLYGTASNSSAIIESLEPKKRGRTPEYDVSLADQNSGVIFVLVTGDNRVVIFVKNHRQKVYQLNYIDRLTEILSLDFFAQSDTMPDPFIKQAVLVSLGDRHSTKEYLSLLTMGGEVILYELFMDSFSSICRFKKVDNLLITGAPDNAFSWGTKVERSMVYINTFESGLKVLFVSGIIPFVIIKESHSDPRIFRFTSQTAIAFARFGAAEKGSDFIFVDHLHNARICSIPFDDNTDYTNLLPIQKIPVGQSIKAITYHETSHVFVLATSDEIDYNCLDEMGQLLAGSDKNKPHALSYKGYLKLVSARSWNVIDSWEFEDNQVAITVKSMFLTTASTIMGTRKKEVVLVGTGKLRMEDLIANGSFHVFEIVKIIPELDKPEFDRKFKELFHEDTRGAVTATTEVSGRFLVSQGQKVMVRDLQEDNTVVPVGFLDMSIYVSEAKCFGNLMLLGDVMKSVSLVGFDAEPYRMIQLSQDVFPVDVNAADFIATNGALYIVIGDNNGHLHLLQYNPEDPASISGQRLVRKATVNLNTVTTCMRSVPQVTASQFKVMGSCIDGSMYTVTPISEEAYRRMYVLQQQLIDKEQHHLGLNPKLNRVSRKYEVSNSTFKSGVQSRGLIDHEVLQEFMRLSLDRKKQLALKAGQYAYLQLSKDFVELSLNLV